MGFLFLKGDKMSIEKLRQEIDNLDKKLIELLNERARVSLQMLQEKQRLKLPIYNQQREQQVLQQVIQQNKGPLTSEQVKSIFQRIIESCRAIQQKQKGIE